MSHPISYHRAVPPPRPHWWPGAIAISLAMVVGACIAWEKSWPALGERPLTSVKSWTTRCAAASLWMAAHALLIGVALPAIYRPRAIYSGLTALSGLVALLAGISAGALWFAS